MRYSLSLVMCLLSSVVFSAPIIYEAPLEDATWSVGVYPNDTQEALECELKQSISNYGDVQFIHRAGHPFILKTNVLGEIKETSPVYLWSSPPIWRDERLIQLASINIKANAKKIVFKDDPVWRALTELEKGLSPTIEYVMDRSPEEALEIRLSPVNFQQAFEKFVLCEQKLFPYSFEDIKTTVVWFEENSVNLTKESKEKLNRIRRFYDLSSTIQSIKIVGHSDNRGKRNIKQYYSQKRAYVVKDFLMETLGFEKNKFDAKGLSDSNPIADNGSKIGREKNRRAVIYLIR